MKKVIKWFLISLACLVLIAETGLLLTGNFYVNKVLALTILSGKSGPDIDEVDLFPKHKVENGTPQPWPVSPRYGRINLPDETLRFMEEYQTVSYLVVHDDSVLFEKNWEGYSDSSYVNSFSMAKSINALLIGCALHDGLIKSLDDPAGQYLADFRDGHKSRITIRHLLTMSSGLGFMESYGSPFAWPAEAYYGPDVNALTLNVAPAAPPGQIWHYKGGDSQLLGMILKSVLGEKTIAEYASEKLWKPIGAEYPAYWSTDNKGMEKVSCCWYTNARDYARLVKLMMHYGDWNGTRVIDSAYVAQSLMPASGLIDTDDRKPISKYGYQWWLLEHKGHRVFYMRGIRGQYVFGIPDMKLIVVRLGHKRAAKTGGDIPSDVYVYLDAAMAMK